MVRLVNSVLVAAAALFSSTTTAAAASPSAAFVADDLSIAFALNIPQDDKSNELYFSISGPRSCSWLAVGMGNGKMDDSLIFMVYSDSSGKNVTLSPRLTSGHVEPSLTKLVNITLLAGSGIVNNTVTVNAKCSNCRSWNGGIIDPKNNAAKFIWANGPSGDLKSNSLTANTRRHASYGTFRMDLTKAVGPAGTPPPATNSSKESKQLSEKVDHHFASPIHACIMILSFLGLMPMGVLVLRILKSPKWHGVNQAISLVVALTGVSLGFYIGTFYNRTKKFGSAHQIFGIIIAAMMIAQFVLGFMHHRIYKKTQAPTKLSPIHVWLGRLVIPAGIANGFLGFPLAQNSKYNWALVALTLFIVIILAPVAFWRYRRNIQKAKTVEAVGGYDPQPWRTAAPYPQNDINLGQMNYPPPPPPGYNGYNR
ncbi:CBD9-like protein [Venustampulla echinocandica]|uniref:CBD9-like protein n=1 Tax=Venustampulla echinocandica TaxID=2656787 RepID=A0A370TPQ8_9HELO|nr:CBD9-like protein [Venustampulla echinocandica]RDL37505.1 CBD9-like protein [Venustampulla echinocandica]